MFKARLTFLLIVTMATLVSSNCDVDKIAKTGNCSYRFQCSGSVRGIQLADECRGSKNFDVFVDLTLTDMSGNEKFDKQDSEFLESITMLRATGKWTQANLTFLEYMPRITRLNFAGNQIKKINGIPFFNLIKLEILDLSKNQLADVEGIFQFEKNPNKLKKLFLAYNAIQFVSAYAFSELTSLAELDLSHNLISDLNEEPFYNLTSLETLKLNNNQIKYINGAVNNLRNLKHLYLRGNYIQNIEAESLNVIDHLQTFDISGNMIDTMKPMLFSRHWQHFGGSCKIILSGNKITRLPNATKELTSRFTRHPTRQGIDVQTEVDLANNAISNIEYNAFQSIVRLISLDLSCNKLGTFVVNPNDLIDVKYLNLSSNTITNLYFGSFFSMSNLQNLDLSHNRLMNVPEQTFVNNYNLKYVNMTYNSIKFFENLRIKMFHGDGGILDLSNNGLTRLYVPSGEEFRLTMLILASNQIRDASQIYLNQQSKLRNLNMSSNKIQKLDKTSLHLPLTLMDLDLSNNTIEKIGPGTFHTTQHLRTLRLSYNKLEEIEYGAFQGLTDLSYLCISHNNIRFLNSEVLMDLKSLSILSLKDNGMLYLDYNAWLGHKNNLRIYLDGNSLSCQWLAKALNDFNNGYSKMRPAVFDERSVTGHSLEGIPCMIDKEDLRSDTGGQLADDRLLVTNQKILEAVREQTSYLRSFLQRARYTEILNNKVV